MPKNHIDRIQEIARGRNLTEEEKEKLAVLESIVIALEGMIRYARRYAAMAEEKAAKEKDPQRKAELLKAAEGLQVRTGKSGQDLSLKPFTRSGSRRWAFIWTKPNPMCSQADSTSTCIRTMKPISMKGA